LSNTSNKRKAARFIGAPILLKNEENHGKSLFEADAEKKNSTFKTCALPREAFSKPLSGGWAN